MFSSSDPLIVYIEDDSPSRQIVQVLVTRVMKLTKLVMFENSNDLMSRLASLEQLPSVFFLDVQMKPYDGYEVLQMLRSDSRYARSTIIAMTANVMSHDVEKLKQAGFDGLIGKPLAKEVFPQQVGRILQGEPVWFVP